MQTFQSHEIFFECMGWNFHIIYGQHSSGYYIAIPNFDVCVEASNYGDIFYNNESLSRCNNPCVVDCSHEIAIEIENFFMN